MISAKRPAGAVGTPLLDLRMAMNAGAVIPSGTNFPSITAVTSNVPARTARIVEV